MPEVWFPNLGVKIDRLPKVAFEVFNVPIYVYALCITFGVIVGYLLAEREAKRLNLGKDIIFDYISLAMFVAIAGARLYYIIFTWDSYKDNLIKVFNIREGGLAIYGGIIAAVIYTVFFVKKRGIKLSYFLDALAPSLAIGQSIGRCGNFFNREVFGRYTENLFAMRYLKNQVPSIPDSVLQHIVVEGGAEYIQVEPTFLYESLWNLGVFFILFYMQRHKKFDGQVAAFYFLLYGVGRAWIEGIRTDQLLFLGFPVSVMVSVILAAVSVIYISKNFYKYKQGGKLT
ncbi:MAG: prolipoprotein diacylglyceryl transferase [Clostridiales bacterium]|jgi:phosphatidylglycerol:prolipoprotein diacylglycerol transferase|nr:prolipoprotein diacylglyceryl transferase [Clostridiales bacterium]